MKIACCQFAPHYRDLSQNLESIRNTVCATDADVCVFPELALTGYFFKNIEEIIPLGQTIDGELSRELAAIAKEGSKAIITGFLERSNDRFFNSSLAFNSQGELVGHYRKIHLFYFEKQVFTRGNLGFPVFDLKTRNGVVRTGMLICYDWRFPEAARSLALHGAELIAMPSNIVTTTGMLHTTLQTRSFENKVIVAFADRIGSETNGDETLLFRGESSLINFSGEIMCKASADKPESIIAEFDVIRTREKRINEFNDIFGDRQPKFYS